MVSAGGGGSGVPIVKEDADRGRCRVKGFASTLSSRGIMATIAASKGFRYFNFADQLIRGGVGDGCQAERANGDGEVANGE